MRKRSFFVFHCCRRSSGNYFKREKISPRSSQKKSDTATYKLRSKSIKLTAVVIKNILLLAQ